MNRDGVDEVGLARLQCGEPRGIFSDFAKDDFFDCRFAAPVVVVASENQIAAALETDKLIGTGAYEVLIQLIAELIAGDFADDVAVAQVDREKSPEAVW